MIAINNAMREIMGRKSREYSAAQALQNGKHLDPARLGCCLFGGDHGRRLRQESSHQVTQTPFSKMNSTAVCHGKTSK